MTVRPVNVKQTGSQGLVFPDAPILGVGNMRELDTL